MQVPGRRRARSPSVVARRHGLVRKGDDHLASPELPDDRPLPACALAPRSGAAGGAAGAGGRDAHAVRPRRRSGERAGRRVRECGIRGVAGRSGQRLLMGPWGHQVNSDRKFGEVDFGHEAVVDLYTIMNGFLDEAVGGRVSAEPVAPARVFLMGANEWLDLPACATVWSGCASAAAMTARCPSPGHRARGLGHDVGHRAAGPARSPDPGRDRELRTSQVRGEPGHRW